MTEHANSLKKARDTLKAEALAFIADLIEKATCAGADINYLELTTGVVLDDIDAAFFDVIEARDLEREARLDPVERSYALGDQQYETTQI